MKMLGRMVVVGLVLALAASAQPALADLSVGSFTGADPGEGLDLEGEFLYALDFYGSGGTISYAPNVQFLAIPVPHACHTGGSNSGGVFDYGSSVDDNLLESMMHEQLFGWTEFSVTGSAATGLANLIPNRDYQIQLLFQEHYWQTAGEGTSGQRVFDIEVEGTKIVDDYDAGFWTHYGSGGVVRYTFTAQDTVLNIRLIGETGAPTMILNAMTVEVLPAPEPAGLGLIGIGLLALRRRRT